LLTILHALVWSRLLGEGAHLEEESSQMTDMLSRRDLVKRAGVLGAIASAGPLVAACGGITEDDDKAATGSGSTLESAKKAGRIRVGFANEAPYDFADSSGKLTGEAPEVARVILKNLGIPELEGVLTTFDALIPGLKAKRFDIVAAGMFITPERCAEILFSNPDYAAPEALAVPKGNPKGLSNYEDVAKSGASLGVLSGAVEGGLAESAGVKKSQLKTFPDQVSMIEGLKANRVDAFSLTSISIRQALKTSGGGEVEMATPFFPVVDGKKQIGGGGYGFRKGDEDFRDAFNAELKKLQDANGVLPIVQKFGFGKAEVDAAADITADQLCKG
jgi:polar amino acid transport system substrate-binding protein